MNKYFVGIDQSKRSTGCVMLTSTGDYHDCALLVNSTEESEALISWQWSKFYRWLCSHIVDYDYIGGALIEGLAFSAKGNSKDFLAGLQWYFRTRFSDDLGLFLGTIPVSMWRSKVLTKEEQALAKTYGKNGIKKATFDKLPVEIQSKFLIYTERMGVDESSVYDLTDAYFIAQHCLKLFTGK